MLISGEGMSREAALARMSELGRSVLVVGDETLLRLHVHTEDPGAAISYGTASGTLLKVKVENMEEQYRAWVAAQREEAASPTPGAVAGWTVVAVTPGDGMAEVLRGLGVSHIVSGGQTNNPSTEELVAGIQAAEGEGTFVLPNNKNIVLAARQAATVMCRPVRVIPTKTFPQGVAAILAFSPEATPDENERAMTAAAGSVHTIEVTRAIRSAHVDGVRVEAGQFIAIVDGRMTLGAETAEDAGLLSMEQIVTDETVLVTIYWGGDADGPRAQELADRVRSEIGGFEVEVVRGGQPLYPYVISLE